MKGGGTAAWGRWTYLESTEKQEGSGEAQEMDSFMAMGTPIIIASEQC